MVLYVQTRDAHEDPIERDLDLLCLQFFPRQILLVKNSHSFFLNDPKLRELEQALHKHTQGQTHLNLILLLKPNIFQHDEVHRSPTLKLHKRGKSSIPRVGRSQVGIRVIFASDKGMPSQKRLFDYHPEYPYPFCPTVSVFAG